MAHGEQLATSSSDMPSEAASGGSTVSQVMWPEVAEEQGVVAQALNNMSLSVACEVT